MSTSKMIDMVKAERILGFGIERHRNEKKICINQNQFIYQMLKRFNMHDCYPSNMHISLGLQLPFGTVSNVIHWKNRDGKDSESGGCGTPSHLCRPDMNFAVSYVSRFNAGKFHWSTINIIFRHFRGAANFQLEFFDQIDNIGLANLMKAAPSPDMHRN
ncbi:hypothetical protein JTB14_028416 [Gonioctena quinquepunctata]|nr:hypothetical protein JTB14_028416 [Gonioctena quinquepunctata]